MRIWILNHYASPPDRPAGTRHYEFGRVLAAQGHEITIFASSFSHFSRQEERLALGERARVEWVDGVRFVWVRTTRYTRNDLRRVGNMLSYAVGVVLTQRRFSRPDVVVGSSVHLAAVAAAWLIARARRVPFVFEVRDLWPQTLIDMGALRERGVAARMLRGAERFLYQQARVVITLLRRARNSTRKNFLRSERNRGQQLRRRACARRRGRAQGADRGMAPRWPHGGRIRRVARAGQRDRHAGRRRPRVAGPRGGGHRACLRGGGAGESSMRAARS